MSVIDFISVRRSKDDRASAPTPSFDSSTLDDKPSKVVNGPLSATQFTQHVTHIVEDEMKRAMKRHVDVVDPREIISLCKMIADLKGRYMAMTLLMASNNTPMTDSEVTEMRATRQKIMELEAAYNELNDLMTSNLIDVKGVMKD